MTRATPAPPALPVTLDDVLYRVEATRARLGDSADPLRQGDAGELGRVVEDVYRGLDEIQQAIEAVAARTLTPAHPARAQRLF